MLRFFGKTRRWWSGARASAWFTRAHRPFLEVLEDRTLPSTLTVMNLADNGTGSLRAQVAAATSGDTIDFTTGLTGTITLTSGEIAFSKNLTIQGPGSGVLSVSGNNASRIFNISSAT